MIYINIKKSKKVPGVNSCFLSFSQYNELWVDIIRSFPTRVYHKDTQEWEFPIFQLDKVINRYRTQHIKINYVPEHLEQKKIPDNFVFKTPPYKHQVEGIEYGLTHDKWILGDEQGLGKTYQLINLAVARKMRGEIKQCLIICGVATLRWNWEAEIKEHSNESCFVLGTRYRKNGNVYCASVKERVDDLKNHKEFFLITNAETLLDKNFIEVLVKHKSQIDMIAVDECHKLGNTRSQRGNNLQKLKDFTYKVAMSGTPLMNSPLDAYAPLSWIDQEKSTFGMFKRYYCQYSDDIRGDMTGYKNLGHLRQQLESCMLRRRKEDVLDLPPKIFSYDYVEMGPKQQCIYDEAKDWVLQNIDLISASPNPLAQLIRLRQATGYTGILSSSIQVSAKLDRMEEIVEDIIKEDRKVLIFSNWEKITQEALNRLVKYNPAYIAGSSIKDNEIESEKRRFQNDPTCKVIIGTIGKLGTGHTLTAATTVLFLDSPWNMSQKSQAIDRAHRIGTTGTINIRTLVTKDTIDERIEEILQEKSKNIDFLVDGKSPEKIKELVKFLLS